MKAICLLFLFLVFHSLRAQTLYRYGLDKKFGYMDSSGKTIIEPQYEKAGRFENGLAPVKVGKKYGYINKQNKLVIPATFDHADAFTDGAAVVIFKGKYGAIKRTGAFLIKPKFTYMYPPEEGMFVVQQKDSLYGFYDTTGKQVTPIIYPYVSAFRSGFAKVATARYNYGYINRKGELVIPARYLHLSRQFGEGIVAVKDSILGYYYLDSTGKTLMERTFTYAGRFSEGIAFVKTGRQGYFMDKTGKDLFHKKFKDGGEFTHGVCKAQTDSGYVIIDTAGNVLDESRSRSFLGYYGGFVVFADHDMGINCGFMNDKFEVVSGLRFYQIDKHPKQYMEVRLADKKGPTNIKAHINKEGKILVQWTEEQE